MVVRGQMNVGGSQNGYMTDETFSDWAEWFIEMVKELKQQRNYAPEPRSVLFLDGHITRNNAEMML